MSCAALAAASAATSIPLNAAKWVGEGFDPAAVLATRPAECLLKPADAEENYKVELGRAAFRTPLLLGGQAARAGIACDSCHRNGRNNPSFHFPGLSGKPGTADVTSSLFSSHRGDSKDNPLPIRDLSATSDKLVILRNRQNPNLQNFIHGQITEEFNGAEPPPAVMAGMAAYVRALDPSACPASTAEIPITARGVMADAVRAVRTAGMAATRKDYPSAVLMLASARTQLGLVHERYAAADLSRERAAIKASDLELAALQTDLRAQKANLSADLAAWGVGAERLTRLLEASERRSLFNPAILAKTSKP